MRRLYILASLLLLVLVACAAPPATPPKQVVPLLENTVLQPGAVWQAEWDSVLAKARKEGTVAISSDGGATLRDALIKGFKGKYGIDADIVGGKGAQLAEKIITEQRNGLYLVDVQHGGATTKITNLKPAGAYAPLTPMLIRPDILDSQYWQPGQPSWVDKDHMVLNIEYSASGRLGINTDLVKASEIKSLRDLLDPKWKGKIIMNDPTVAGTGAKFVGVAAVLIGWDIWREMAKQEPVILRDEKLMVTWLAMGKYPLIISPKPEPMADAKAAGAPIDEISVPDAQYSSGDTISLMKNAPHPNAAKVYINWLLSQEGQTVYHTAQSTWSARKDVVLNSTPAKKPVPGVKYFDSNNEEFLLSQPEQMRMAREIFGPLMK